MMGLIDRINRRIVRRLRRDDLRIMVEPDGLRVAGSDGDWRLLPFATLTQATVSHRDVYAGDAIVLEMAFAGGDRIAMMQDDPRWRALVDALDRSGRIATPSREWELQAITDGEVAPPRRLL